jgi:hypothetical protein
LPAAENAAYSRARIGCSSASCLSNVKFRARSPEPTPSPVEHLGDEREVRHLRAEVRLVVVRDQRADEPRDALERHTGDRDETLSCVLTADDVRSVRELVEPERVEVQRAPVSRGEREDPRVTVARADERNEPHELDEELVRREALSPLREAVDLRVKPTSRDVPVGARVLALEPFRDRADVV